MLMGCKPDEVTARVWAQLLRVTKDQKKRCTNPKCNTYAHYGARGIRFDFESPTEAAMWVLRNIGLPKSSGATIDRIDNARHYERGNLRWATRSEQMLNRRVFRLTPEGERIRALCYKRPDYNYESIRAMVKAGMSDDQIIGRVKWKHQEK